MQEPGVALPIKAHPAIKGPDKDSERWQKDQGPGMGQGSQWILEAGVPCSLQAQKHTHTRVRLGLLQPEQGLVPLPGLNPKCSGAAAGRTGWGQGTGG